MISLVLSPLWWLFTAGNFVVHISLLTLGWMILGEHPVWLVRSCARTQLLAAGTRLKVTGLENLPVTGGVLLAANHKSYFDIFALLAVCPRYVRWVLKESLLKVPLLGAFLKQNRAVALNRDNPGRAARQLVAAARDLAAGEAFVVFPEGTRIAGVELGTFKGGAFQMALRAGCPIIPLAISKAEQVLPPRGFFLDFGGSIELHFLPPVDPASFTDDREGLGAAVREAIAKTRASL